MLTEHAPSVRRLRLDFGYHGARFAGWARQPASKTAGKPTVEGTLGAVLERILGEPVQLTVAGRTDTGVHAENQVASFDTHSPLPAAAVLRLLRTHLLPDIWALDASEAPSGFDARRSALRRWYRYAIWRGPQPPAEWVGRALAYPDPLDIPAMRRAARLLIGRHDRLSLVSGWGQDARPDRSTVRSVFAADWLTPPGTPLLLFEICGDAFLRQMVRTTVGSLLWVGTGRWSAADFLGALQARDRRAAGPTAPAHGLTLLKIEYPSPSTPDGGTNDRLG